MPRSKSATSLNYEPRVGRAACADSVPRRRQRLLRLQVADYAKHFTCIRLIRAAPRDELAAGTYSTELFADDVAAFMAAIGVERM